MGSLTLSIELDGGKIVDTACLSMSCGSPWGAFFGRWFQPYDGPQGYYQPRGYYPQGY